MESELICLDTSVLIDYFRKTKKENSFFYDLSKQYSLFAVSVVTEFEIFSGINSNQEEFWKKLFDQFTIIPMNSKIAKEAVDIYQSLKQNRKLIEVPDIFIGATARSKEIKLATINVKHFERIDKLELIVPKTTA